MLSEKIDTLYHTQNLDDDGLKLLMQTTDTEALFDAAQKRRREWYGMEVYKRGLIEFTNYCKNNCYYCGIRAGNRNLTHYRLSEAQILECCAVGYPLGFRTFVLQGGEDLSYSTDDICRIVSRIKTTYPDCAVTLSIGEKTYGEYKAYREAGADRYLLRHETADEAHYAKIHPDTMSLENRKRCLFDLKKLGYQVGSGFMVGSPYQTLDCLVADLRFLQQLHPAMIGIGPFLPHKDTPFAAQPKGSLALTLNLIAILRLMFPNALIPSTTSLGTIHPNGRELGLKAGANVVMPNLSPVDCRKNYALYDGKICMGDEAAQCAVCLQRRVACAGFQLVVDRGDMKAR